jgi:hypothetical protein
MKRNAYEMNKYFCMSVLLPLFIFILAVFGCGGGNNGSNETDSIAIAQYFPLSSGWETDSWTLFTDELTHQINSTSAKPMIDSSRGKGFYWSNDENGIQLHAVWSLESQMVYYSQALQVAAPVFRIGDFRETIYTLSNDSQNTQYVFTSQLQGSEAITTASGTYADCLKFRFHLYPLGSSPKDYGYETVWLGKDIGLVRAQADDNSLSELFVGRGTTRQLISFSTTPASISPEETEVRDAYKLWINFWNEKDIASIGDMIHDAYYESCRNKASALAYWNDFLNKTSEYKFFATIEDVILDGNNAYVVSEYLEFYTDLNGEGATRKWGKSSVRMAKDDQGWRIYGNQFQVYPSWISVYPRVTASGTTFALPVEIVDCATGEWAETPDQIAGLQVTGPPNSGVVDLELVDNWDPDAYWSGFWTTLDISTAKNGFYTFHVTDINGNYLLYTDYLATTFTIGAPLLTSPEDGVTGVSTEVVFEWQAVTSANKYMLEVFEVDAATGVLGAKAISLTTDQTSHTAILDSGKKYNWRVRSRYYDPNDGDAYDSESRSAFRTFSTSSS